MAELRKNCSKILYLIFSVTTFVFSKIDFGSKDSCLELLDGAQLILDKNSFSSFSGILKYTTPSLSDILIAKDSDASIFFNGGVLQQGSKKINFTGNILCSKAQKTVKNSRQDVRVDDIRSQAIIQMTGDQTLDLDLVSVAESVQITGTNNKIIGRPTFLQPIELADELSSLELRLQNKLSQNILLNGGSIILGDDLSLKDNTSFLGSGTIYLNSHSLYLPAVSATGFTSDLTFVDANDMQLTGYTTLNGTWTFQNADFQASGSSSIGGNGYVLDISGGGSIVVGPNHTLYIAAIDLKGVGASGGSFSIHPTSTVVMSNTIFELKGNYNLSSGKILIKSPDCKMAVKDTDTLVITGTNAVFEIDGVVFNYESVGNAPVYPPPFYPNSGGSISLINGGTIQCINFELFKGEFRFTMPSYYFENQLVGGVTMTSKTIVHFINENIANKKYMVLNCNGNRVKYDIASPGSVVLDENTEVTIKNLVMDNLDFSKVRLDGSGPTKAKFFFGLGCNIYMGQDNFVDSLPWTFKDSASVSGNNFKVTLNGADKITIENGGTLTIQNATLNFNNASCMRCLDDNCKIILDNCAIELDENGWLFDKGTLQIRNMVDVYCTRENMLNTLFSFTSKGKLIIEPRSRIRFRNKVQILFSPTPVDVSESTDSLKRRIQFLAPCSTLLLQGASFDASSCGVRIGDGCLMIQNKVAFSLSPTVGKELELSSSARLRVDTGGTIAVNGPVIYV